MEYQPGSPPPLEKKVCQCLARSLSPRVYMQFCSEEFIGIYDLGPCVNDFAPRRLRLAILRQHCNIDA